MLKDVVCLSITFHLPGDQRRGSLDNVEVDAEKSEVRLRKRIFDSLPYREAQRLAVETRRWLESRSVPSPLKQGTYLIPRSRLEEVEQKIASVRAVFDEIADEFIAEYPALIEEWKKRLRSQFDERNYPPPDVMRRRFWVERVVVDFSLSSGIEQSAELEQAVVEIKAALRYGLMELVERLAKMLGDRKDGRKKGLRREAFEAINEWFDLLPSRLVVEDEELRKLAEKAKAVLAGKSIDDLRDLDDVRSQVRDSLEKVGSELRTMVKELPTRAFCLDD